MEEKVKEILKSINDEILEYKEGLLDDGIIDSFTVIEIVEELEHYFDIRISPDAIVADNFNSLSAIIRLVTDQKGA